ncbi:hypothetical protein MASR1M12_04080 [Erysipelotrichia bacterium]
MVKKHCLLFLAAAVFLLTWSAAMAATIADSESASHSDEAAKYKIVASYEGTGLRIVQFNLGVLSHYSYLLISDGKVLAVDPGRDIAAYLAYANDQKLEWVGTFLTHSHADFVAGHTEMAAATGKPVFVSHKSGAEYPHLELKDDSTIEVGKALLKIMETPGHTPDSLCGVVSPAAIPDKQEFLLSGDTLFVGSLGRPDLMGGSYSAAELAGMMFDTWNKKLSRLRDNLVVLPAHGAGSLCGAHLSDAPSSTIGEEKISNHYLKFVGNRSAFIANFISGLEPAPQYFGENARINRSGPEKIDWENPLGPEIDNPASLIADNGVYFVDVRDAAAYAAAHIPRSVNIALRGRFETWTGIIVPFKSRLVLVGSLSELTEAARRLKRVGYNAEHVLFDEYVAAGGQTVTTRLVQAVELHEQMLRGEAPVVVDVRRPNEYFGMKIGEVLNIPLDILEKQAPARLAKDQTVVAVCNSAFRSNLAVGLLERAGFTAATSMQGGSEAWLEAGLPVVKIAAAAETKPAIAPAGSSAFRSLNLPDRISADQLQKMIRDLPGTFEIIDIRPFEQVEDYNPVGAKQVDIADLLENLSWQAGDVPLVIVDRDGSLAMIAAGILSRKTHRPIKALLGGIEGYWRATEMKFMRERMLAPAGVAPVFPTQKQLVPGQITDPQPISPAKSPVPPAPAAKPVRKGAGC